MFSYNLFLNKIFTKWRSYQMHREAQWAHTVNLVEHYLRVNRIEEYTIQMIIMQLMSGLGDPQFNIKTYRNSILARTDTGALRHLERRKINESMVLIRGVLQRLAGNDEFTQNVMFILRQLLGNLDLIRLALR